MATYIVVADAARARVFARNIEGTALEVADLVHPESRLHTGDLRTGGKGEVIETGTGSSRQPDNQTTTMEKHAAFFAKELAAYLQDVRVNNRTDELVLVAAPKFLGALRKKLDATTRELVTKSVDKDLSKASHAELQKYLKTL